MTKNKVNSVLKFIYTFFVHYRNLNFQCKKISLKSNYNNICFFAVCSPTGEVHLLQDGLITLSGITNCLTADRVVIQNYEESSDISVWLKFPLTNSCKLRKPAIPHSLNNFILSHLSN